MTPFNQAKDEPRVGESATRTHLADLLAVREARQLSKPFRSPFRGASPYEPTLERSLGLRERPTVVIGDGRLVLST